MTKIFRFLLFFLIFGFTASSQQIGGKLVDRYTGEAVVEAKITGQDFTVITEVRAGGVFRLEAVEFPLNLRISAPGYITKNLRFEKAELDRIVLLTPLSEFLSEVVVRSTLMPDKVLRTPASVGILGRKEMDRTDGVGFVGVLNSLSGIYVHQGALNTNKLSIRGIGARSQYSTNRIKAYFEGIPISTAEGETTLDDLDMSVIGKVEVVKGPNSSIYGAGLGGVINLYAGEAEVLGTHASAGTLIGSYGLLDTGLKVSHVSEGTSLFAAYNKLHSDSFRENGAYDRESISVYGKLAGGNSNSLSFFANYINLLAYIPSSISKEKLLADPASAAFTWNAAKGYESYDKGMLGIGYDHYILENLQHTSSAFANFRDAYEPRPFDILKEDQMSMGVRSKFNLSTHVFGLASGFSVGGEYVREWYDSATFENLYEDFPDQGSVRGSHLSDNSQLRSYYNFFGQWNLSLAENLTLETGFNLHGTSYELTDLYLDDTVDQSGDYEFETIFSPRIAAVYELTPGKSIYANLSHGFSIPTVAQTLTPEGLINLELQPETGINYEVGFKGNWLGNTLYSEVALYSIQIKDLLVAERVAEDQYIGKNAGRTAHNGLEVLLRSDFQIARGLSARPFVNASFNFFEFRNFVDNGIDYSGNTLPGVPEHTINAGIDLISDLGFSVYSNFFHSGKIHLNDANEGFSKSYELVNLKAAYKHGFSRNLGLEVSLGVNNIFDEAYAASVLPNAVGFGGAAPRYYYPGTPRNYFGGLKLSYIL